MNDRANSRTQSDYQERILRVLVHIQKHLDEALCLEDLAELACFSRYHFHRVFRGIVGEPLMEYVRRLRLERAAFRLKQTDAPVTRIAFEAGYETHEAFTRAFHTMFGQSPSAYRQARRNFPYPNAPSGIHYQADTPATNLVLPTSGESTMEATIERLDSRRVAFVRHTGPYMECGQAWHKLCAWAGPRGLLGPKAVFLGISHDDPDVTPPERIRYDACIVVGAETAPDGEVGVQELAGGDYARTIHRGPYSRLNETYAQVCGQWIPAQRRELRSAPSFEVYRNDPNTTPPEDLVTDVYVPLQ